MKRSNKTLYAAPMLALLTALLFLAAGCAPPQASTELQQRIEELLLLQQQQAEQLAQLQQKLSGLPAQPADLAQVVIEPSNSTEPPMPQKATEILPLPLAPSAAEIAAISEAARLYLEAFAAIATAQMEKAEAGFKAFIQRFPDHEYTGNANYWMAEAQFSQQKSKSAETVLLNIIDNPKQQNKAPAAMARLVNYYLETGARNNAAALTQMLNDRYPDSPELKRLKRSTEPR